MFSPELILIVNWRSAFFGTHQLADGGSSSLSSTQKDHSPSCVGVPLTRPFFASERPGGSMPLRILNWYGRPEPGTFGSGPQPEAPSNWWWYGWPVTPTGVRKLASVNLSARAVGATTSASSATKVRILVRRIRTPFRVLSG